MTVQSSGSAVASGRRASRANSASARRAAGAVPQWGDTAPVWTRALTSLDASSVPAAVVGLDGIITAVNDALCALTGFAAEFFRGLALTDLSTERGPTGADRLESGLGQLLGDEMLKCCRTADRRELIVMQYRREQRTDDGQLVAHVVRFADVSELLADGRRLEQECHHLRQAQSISRVGSWHYEIGNRGLAVSDTLLDLYGLDRDIFIGTYDVLDACVHPDDQWPLIAATQRLRETGEPMSMRYRVTRPTDGQECWFDARGVVLRDPQGQMTHIAGTVADVTDLMRAEADARRAHAELSLAHSYQQAVIMASPDAIHVYDVATSSLSRANRAETPLIGFTDDAARALGGHQVEELIPADELDELNAAFAAMQHRADGEVISLRHRVERDGTPPCWLSRRLTPFQRDEQGAVTQILVVSRDVTDVVAVEQRLEQAALHDDLTGLPNRRLVLDRLEHSLKRAARGGHIAVLACDLDGFKRINDAHGHRAGDRVLTATAAKLVDATRVGDTVARLAGDEFVVILDIPQHVDPHELAEQVAARIVSMVAEPVVVDGTAHTVTVSVGLSVAQDITTAEDILSDADTAMYHTKARGGDGHTLFHLSLRPDTARRDHVERQIRRALADDTIEVFYQPIVNPYTSRLYGVEALLRIPDVDGRYLNTAEAIEICEQTGLVAEVDQRVLRLACAQAALWRREAHPDLMLKINRSVKDITKPGFHDRIQEALRESGFDARALTLEITETVLLDADAAGLADLWRLNEAGIGLAIDDFGTGYAPMRYLAELPITCIKIDRSFTIGLPHDPKAMTLVRTTVGLAEQLGITCVVEGVEKAEQLDALPHYDRLLIQGYLFGRPQPPSSPLRAELSQIADVTV